MSNAVPTKRQNKNISFKGDRSHVLALLCDCQAVDDTFDRLVGGRPLPDGRWSEIWSVIPPLILLAVFAVSQLGTVWLVVAHASLFPLIIFLHRTLLRRRPRTKFFASWYVCSTALVFYVYQMEVLGFIISIPKTISFWENLFLILPLVATLYSVREIRGRAKRDRLDAAPDGEGGGGNANVRYCKACQCYVEGKDHHCVWIDCCVSRSNKKLFVAFLGLELLTLVQAGLLLLTSVCDRVQLVMDRRVLVPVDCSDYNKKFIGNKDLTKKKLIKKLL